MKSFRMLLGAAALVLLVTDPADPASGLNPAILDQWDSWFAEMDRAGITIYFFLFDDSVRLYDTETCSRRPSERSSPEWSIGSSDTSI